MSSATSADRVLLVVNIAEERLQIVLGTDHDLLFAEEIHCPGQSIRHLHTGIDRGLRVHGLTARDLAGLACVRGPGSFTGLRIAHAAVHGFARPLALPMAGLEYHSLLARQVGQPDRELWVITYARKGYVYAQGFCRHRPLAPIRVLPVPDMREHLLENPKACLLVGSGVRKNPALLDISRHDILPSTQDAPAPAVVLEAARAATYTTTPPMPLYLRKSDAEENLQAIAQSRGISEEDARRPLHQYD